MLTGPAVRFVLGEKRVAFSETLIVAEPSKKPEGKTTAKTRPTCSKHCELLQSAASKRGEGIDRNACQARCLESASGSKGQSR